MPPTQTDLTPGKKHQKRVLWKRSLMYVRSVTICSVNGRLSKNRCGEPGAKEVKKKLIFTDNLNSLK